MSRQFLTHRRLVVTAVAGLALAAAAVPAVAATASTSPVTHVSAHTSKHTSVPRLAQQWADAWNTGNAAKMGSLFTRDGVYTDHALNQSFTGPAGAAEWVHGTLEQIAAARVTITRAFRDGDNICVTWTFSGTYKATGKKFSVPATSVFRTKHNRIASVEDFYNLSDLLNQAGLAK
ncbi:hypothetical protein GCM10022251_67670 [Phytohabitans flavus]|uniref:SnoaL-like domain-containing protein n=1 Tax=Phytohabitans flavus TaxID=1076124 RepID=A0A6F8Y4Y3_9ACTN|nr:nuclear transport factor 2 family protein [Phytohabitans flavus]BCB81176.1 hypothetical protein Pflav_075860 [Phytohabitans flavus]